MIKTKFKTTSA